MGWLYPIKLPLLDLDCEKPMMIMDDHGWWNRNWANVLLKPLPNPTWKLWNVHGSKNCVGLFLPGSMFPLVQLKGVDLPAQAKAKTSGWDSVADILFHGRIHRASPRRKDQSCDGHFTWACWWLYDGVVLPRSCGLFEPMPICQPTSRELLKWTSEELVLLYQRICFEISSSTTGKVSR